MKKPEQHVEPLRNRWGTAFQDPSTLTAKERRAEIADILSHGLERYLSETAVPSASDEDAQSETAEVSLNQLDAPAN